MLRPPVVPKKRTLQDPPEIVTPAWLEALTNRKVAATPQAPARPNPGMGQMVDGGRYGTYNSNKWGGLYGKLVDVAKVGDFLIRDPAESLFRTLKGENANTTFNPNSGASLTERIGAFGEDALNVASIVPAMGAADDFVRAVNPKITNFASQLFAKRKPQSDFAPITQNWVPSTPRLKEALVKEQQLSNEIMKKQMDMQYRGTGQLPPEATELTGEDLIRIWHTNPQGSKLPGELLPMEQAARLPGRRGTGATQLLSGGPYGTRSYGISNRYMDDVKDILEADMPSNLPNFMTDYLLDVPANNPALREYATNLVGGNKSNLDRVLAEIRQLQTDDLMNSVYSIDDPVDLSMFDPKTRTAKLGLRMVNEDGSAKTIRQLLDEARTPTEARMYLNDFNRPVRAGARESGGVNIMDSQTPTRFSDFDGMQAAQISKETFKHPIIFEGLDENGLPRYSKVSFTKPGQPTYLRGSFSKYTNRPFSKEYFEEIDRLSAKFEAENPYVSNPYAIYKEEANFALKHPNFRAVTKNPGGMNYWDLPVTRTPSGQIDTVGGLKALDALNFTQETSEAIANSMVNFLSTKYPNININSYAPLIDAAERLHLNPDSATPEFSRLIRQFGMKLDSDLASSANAHSEELTSLENFYQFLADEGYGVIPHTGGQTLGGETHQAFNFLKPEQLPASQYVGGDPIADVSSLANAMQRQKAIQWREANHNPLLDVPYAQQIEEMRLAELMNKAKNKARLAGTAGIQSMLVGSANNMGRNNGR
jgi:hypothetical protein